MTPKTDSVAVLRECPFCGGEAMTYHDEVKPRWVAACAPCGFIGPGEHESRDAAAAVWNRRALSAQPVAWADPEDYRAFANGEDQTFTVYRYGSPKGDVPLYLHPAPPGSDADVRALVDWIFSRFGAPFGDVELPEHIVAAVRRLEAALAARTGKGE